VCNQDLYSQGITSTQGLVQRGAEMIQVYPVKLTPLACVEVIMGRVTLSWVTKKPGDLDFFDDSKQLGSGEDGNTW